MKEDKFKQILLDAQLASNHELSQWEISANKLDQTLFDWISQQNIICAKKIAQACSEFFHCNYVALDDSKDIQIYQVDQIILIHTLSKDTVQLIISNPNDFILKDTIQFNTGKNIHVAFASHDKFMICYHHVLALSLQKALKENPNKCNIKLITLQVLSCAIHRLASDIHIEPCNEINQIRIRVDGLLQTVFEINNENMAGMISSIKVMGKLDIAIKRTPQDGRFSIHSLFGHIREARISTYPTLYGEKIVIRILDSKLQLKKISELGLEKSQQQLIKNNLYQPQGLILVTGPTGSGKTITLYTLLTLLNDESRNIVSIEDPIEVPIKGIMQSQTNCKIGFRFPEALRALLRQDPDIIMLGEIRDKETAQIAVRASQTGHLVLSTLHTNSAAESILRLMNMDIPLLQLAQALTLIVSQRLVRKLCCYCRLSIKNAPLNSDSFQAVGCRYCTDGYQGRIGVFDVLQINEKYRAALLKLQQDDQSVFTNKGLWHAALGHVKNGITTLSEIYRAVPYDS